MVRLSHLCHTLALAAPKAYPYISEIHGFPPFSTYWSPLNRQAWCHTGMGQRDELCVHGHRRQ